MQYFILFYSIFFLSTNQSKDFFQLLNDTYKQGGISKQQQLKYAKQAILSPKKLPLYWQKLLKDHPSKAKCATPQMVKIYREQKKQGMFKDAINYTFPDEMQYILDSETLPLRVEYNTPEDEELARAVLEYAEYSWVVETETYGFRTPPIVSPTGRYLIYIKDLGGSAAGVTVPIGDYYETPWKDCITYVAIDRHAYSPEYVAPTVAHELNHAMQAATDCSEPLAIWENTSTYIELEVYPESIWQNDGFLWGFQNNPNFSISYWQNGSAYQYGAFLWPFFLARYYGPDDNPASFVKDIWENAMDAEDATITINYLQSIDDLLKTSGQGDLNQAFHLFSMARYFMGSDTDPIYSIMDRADEFTATVYVSKVIISNSYATYDFKEDWGVQQYGVFYARILKSDLNSRLLKLTLTPQKGLQKWCMTIYPANHTDLNDIKKVCTQIGASAILEYDPDVTGDVVLSIERYGDDAFNPYFIGGFEDFSLTLEPQVPFPIITSVNPQNLYKNQETTISIYGRNFQEGAEVIFTPSKGIDILNYEYDGDSHIVLTINTTDKVLSGEYDITVKNPDDGYDVFKTEFSFVTKTSNKTPSSCSTSSNYNTVFPLYFLFILLFLFIKYFKIKKTQP